MTTQAIKRWLSRIFAWWPWRKLPETGYAQTASSSNKGSLQEPGWRATVEGTSPQPGITSVAIDHKNDENMPEGSRSAALEGPQETPKVSHQSSAGENSNIAHVPSQNADQAQREVDAPAPTAEAATEGAQ